METFANSKLFVIRLKSNIILLHEPIGGMCIFLACQDRDIYN